MSSYNTKMYYYIVLKHHQIDSFVIILQSLNPLTHYHQFLGLQALQ